jgi:preprotein translocase subunit YajC
MDVQNVRSAIPYRHEGSAMSLFGLIPSAYAQSTAAPASASDLLQNFAPFIIVIGIFYFLLIRPQQQKAKQLKAQLSQLRRGDSVITGGGFIGTVARVVSDDEVTVEIAEGVRVRVVRSTIVGLTAKGEPRADTPKAANDKDGDDDAPPPKTPVRRGRTTAPAKPPA